MFPVFLIYLSILDTGHRRTSCKLSLHFDTSNRQAIAEWKHFISFYLIFLLQYRAFTISAEK